MNKDVTWKDIYRDFVEKHPRYARKIVDYRPYDVCTIVLYFSDGTSTIYEYNTGQLKAVDKLFDVDRDMHRSYFQRILMDRMERAGVSKATLARLTGINPSDITKYTNGSRVPDFYNMSKIAKVLDCNISEFSCI